MLTVPEECTIMIQASWGLLVCLWRILELDP